MTSELAAPFLGGDRNQVFFVVPGSGCLDGALSTQIVGEKGVRQQKQEMKGGIRSDQGQRKEGCYGCGLLPQVIFMHLLSAETSGVSR